MRKKSLACNKISILVQIRTQLRVAGSRNGTARRSERRRLLQKKKFDITELNEQDSFRHQ